MSATEGAKSFVRLNKVTKGWTWSIQVMLDTTIEELREAKDKALKLNEELFADLLGEPEEPEF